MKATSATSVSSTWHFAKRDAVRHELSWTHYRMLSRIENEVVRMEYLHYAIEGTWDTRTLQRNITTQYINRTLVPDTRKKPTPQAQIKDPYIFEFLGIAGDTPVTERKLENELINHLQQFLMELGKGFAFVARQQHIAQRRHTSSGA